MQMLELEVFSKATNVPVLRFPGRKFPGMLIQGDTLSNLYYMAKEIFDLVKVRRVHDALDVSGQLVDDLSLRLREYEGVLGAYGIALPYTSPFSTQGEPPNEMSGST